VCQHLGVRQVLVVLFWLWFVVAVGVYGYRLWRRITQGPKAEREAKAAAAEGRAVGLGERLGAPLAPLPDGPLQPRLPKSLADVGPPAGTPGAVLPGRDTGDPPEAIPADAASGPSPTGRPTVAEALRGIDLPGALVPLVDGDDPAVTEGYKVTFTTLEASARSVAAGLADELERLGYAVADTPVGEGGEHRLRATRDRMAVALAVRVEESGAVCVEVTT
jgi:hypothetical protein